LLQLLRQAVNMLLCTITCRGCCKQLHTPSQSNSTSQHSTAQHSTAVSTGMVESAAACFSSRCFILVCC
jgi:hypothetical protein